MHLSSYYKYCYLLFNYFSQDSLRIHVSDYLLLLNSLETILRLIWINLNWSKYQNATKNRQVFPIFSCKTWLRLFVSVHYTHYWSNLYIFASYVLLCSIVAKEEFLLDAVLTFSLYFFWRDIWKIRKKIESRDW